jgi:hypothetical protein
MASKSLADLEQEIALHQNVLIRLNNEKIRKTAIYNDALSQRPNGIPISWLPAYDEISNTARVTAWFDPNKYGSAFFISK